MSSLESPTVKPGQIHTVSIEKLTFGGAGLAKINNIAVFVKGAIPGQVVEVIITKQKPNYFEARLEKVVKKAKDEVMPRCAHFDSCGGCVWQNIPYNKQIEYKEDLVRETLKHTTPGTEAVREQLAKRVLPIIPSPQVYHYRNKLELSFGYQNMRYEEQNGKRIYFDENPSIGFHKPGEWATVLPITECHLYDEQIGSLIADVNRFLQDTKLSVYNPKTSKGLLRTLLLRRGLHTGEHMIAFVVNARKKELEPIFQQFMRFAGKTGLTSLCIIENTGQNERPENPVVHTLVGQPFITERLFDLHFEIAPFSFFQTNTLGAEKLYQAISDAAQLTQKDVLLDAYCGMGTIGQYLARFCSKVVGIESHPTAIQDALKSATRNKISNISFYKGRTEQVLSQQLAVGGKYAFTTVVVDPPRPGLHPKALSALIKHGPSKIVYVSCNTSTFARDLGPLLEAGYELRTVQPVDMFPHTAHIETVALLQK